MTERTRWTLWWQGGLILLPLAILSGIGFRSHDLFRRQIRADAEREARIYAEELERRLTVWLHERAGFRIRRAALFFDTHPAPPDDLTAAMAFEEAMETGETESRLHRLLEDHPEARSQTGLPLVPIILLQLLQRAGDPDVRAKIVERLRRAALFEHPSVITPFMLEQLPEETEAEDMMRWAFI
ncbi:MAG: hypothetical protein AAF492_09905, partial [Verrucomicrobiota bacterium]